MTAQEILTKYARPSTVHSAEPVKRALLKDLRSQKRFNSRLYGCLFAAVLFVLLIAVASVSTDLIKGSDTRRTALAGAGITVTGMLVWIRRVVREWSQLNLLITLVSYDNESGIQALIQKLLKGLPSGVGTDS